MSCFKGVHHLVPAVVLASALIAPGAMADRTAMVDETMSGYVGSDTCIDCHQHEERGHWFRYTTHGRTGMSDLQGGVGCESCHGPGGEHARSRGRGGDMLTFDELSATETTNVCMDCHDRKGHRYWWGSTHQQRGLSCTSCHQIHQEGPPSESLLIDGGVIETCQQCHMQKVSTLMRSAHMPLREGTMTCTSCHQPHGSPGPSMLAQFSVNENCYSCHAEKRSPMLWEHTPVKEDCTYCHSPHGSVHPQMLNAKLPRLCQQCHDEQSHPTTLYTSARDDFFFPSRFLANHSCLNCHAQIHGTNHPSGVRFQR